MILQKGEEEIAKEVWDFWEKVGYCKQDGGGGEMLDLIKNGLRKKKYRRRQWYG